MGAGLVLARRAVLAALLALAAPGWAQALAPGANGNFTFTGWAGPPMRVWYQLPDRVGPDTKIVFVMHGVKRDADRYLAEWAGLARKHGFIAVVPEFDAKNFPGSGGYNTGYFAERDGTTRLRERWSFAAIEPIFDAVRQRTGSRVPRYSIYGHSAGGQFVHRYVLFTPQARLERAVAANAGWYTLPILTYPFPYGLSGSPATERDLRGALAKPMTVLLGTADTDTADPNLRQSPEANAQGPHRFARGQSFFASAKAAARELKVPFGWRLETVPGVGHKNGEMAVAAAELLAR